jgi:hypothetical protein
VCEAYASIASSAFNDSAAGPEKTFLLGMLDDIKCCSIFDGSSGILEFSLA